MIVATPAGQRRRLRRRPTSATRAVPGRRDGARRPSIQAFDNGDGLDAATARRAKMPPPASAADVCRRACSATPWRSCSRCRQPHPGPPGRGRHRRADVRCRRSKSDLGPAGPLTHRFDPATGLLVSQRYGGAGGEPGDRGNVHRLSRRPGPAGRVSAPRPRARASRRSSGSSAPSTSTSRSTSLVQQAQQSRAAAVEHPSA